MASTFIDISEPLTPPRADDLMQTVLTLKEVLEARTQDAAHESIVAAIEDLLALGPLPLHILKRTLIGKIVNSLSKNADHGRVRESARKLLVEWKRAFRSQKGECEADIQPEAAPGGEPEEDSACAPPDGEGKRQCSQPLGEACVKKRNVSQSLDQRRDKVRRRLIGALARASSSKAHPDTSAIDGDSVAGAVENALHKRWGMSSYAMKARSLLFNLNDPNNVELRQKLLSGVVTPEQIVEFSHDDLASDIKAQAREKIRKEAMEEVQSDWELKNGAFESEGMFTCPKCASKKTTYQQLQSGHGLDEPLTTYVTCFNCTHRWKFDDIGASEDVGM